MRRHVFLLILLLPLLVGHAPNSDAPSTGATGGSGASLLITGADADSTTVQSDSGLELIGGLLTLLRGCADNEVLKWDEVGDDDWNCEADLDTGGSTLWSGLGNPVGDTTLIFEDTEDTTFTIAHEAGDTVFWLFDVSQTDDINATDDLDVFRIEILSESGDPGDTLEAIVISQEAGTANTIIDAAIRIENLENLANTMTNAIIIEASTADAITTALNMADPEITTALAIGDNTITTTAEVLTAAELNTLQDGTDASALHNHTTANLNDTTATGANLNTLTDTSDASGLHSHTTVNLNDTTATGANLNTLTDTSNADSLHTHAAAGIDDGTIDFPDIDYSNENVAADVALAVDECYFVADAGGLFGGIVCEGSAADASEQVYTFPDVNTADSEQEFIFDDTAFVGEVTGDIGATVVAGTHSGTAHHADEAAASEGTAGILEIATQAEADGFTDDLRAITSLKLASIPLAGDVTGDFEATVVGDDSHDHTNLTGTTGASFAVDSDGGGTLLSSSLLIFEGSGADDANETTFLIINPTQDNTITVPDDSVTIGQTRLDNINAHTASNSITSADGEFDQTWRWNLPDPSVANIDAFTLEIQHDDTAAESLVQNALKIIRIDSPGTTALESLLVLENADANAIVDNAISVVSTSAFITDAIDIGANVTNFASTPSGPMTVAEFDFLTPISANVLDADDTAGAFTTITGNTMIFGSGGAFTTMDFDAGGTDPRFAFASDSLIITNVATLTVPNDSWSDEELDEGMAPVWTGNHTFDAVIDAGSVEAFGGTDTTPSVSTGIYFATDGTAQTLTDFDGGVDGQLLFVESTDATVYDCSGTNDLDCGTTNITTVSGDTTMWLNVGGGTEGVWKLISYTQQADDLGTDGGGAEVNNLTTVMAGVATTEIAIGTSAGGVAAYVTLQPCANDEKLEYTDDAPDTMTCEAISGLIDADISDTLTASILNATVVTGNAAADNDVFVATGANAANWEAQPFIDCTNCTSIPAGAHDGTIAWTGTSILDSGAAFQFGDAGEATLTHTYANTGTNNVVAYSSAVIDWTTGELRQGGSPVLLDSDLGGSVQDQDDELDTISGLAETTGNVMIAVASAWASIAEPIIDCTNCVQLPTAGILDATIDQVDIDDTDTLAGNPANGDSSVWFGTTGLIFEGATSNDFEGLLISADITTPDKTWTLPNETGTILTSVSTASGLTSFLNVTATEFAELETIEGTSISAADWVAVAALVGVNTGDNDEVGAVTSTSVCQGDGASVQCDIATETNLETAIEGKNFVTITTDDITSANLITAVSNETGSGLLVFNAAPTFTGIITLPFEAAPATAADGEMAIDLGAWVGDRDAIEVYDGTASTYVLAALVADAPSDGQVPKWKTGGFIEWENDDDSGGAPAFSAITGSTNTTAAMIVGAGASLVVTSTGEIRASDLDTDAVDALTEIAAALKSGDDAELITGTIATTDRGVKIDANDDLVESQFSPDTGAYATSKTECVMLSAGGIQCAGAFGCAAGSVDGTTFDYRTADFDSGATEEDGTWTFQLPTNFTGTTATWQAVWISNNAACDGGASADVCWAIDSDSFSNSVVFNGATLFGTIDGETDNCDANGDILYAPVGTLTHSMNSTDATPETAVVNIIRDTDGTNCGGTADDDLAADASLISVRFCYEVNNVFSGE